MTNGKMDTIYNCKIHLVTNPNSNNLSIFYHFVQIKKSILESNFQKVDRIKIKNLNNSSIYLSFYFIFCPLYDEILL